MKEVELMVGSTLRFEIRKKSSSQRKSLYTKKRFIIFELFEKVERYPLDLGLRWEEDQSLLNSFSEFGKRGYLWGSFEKRGKRRDGLGGDMWRWGSVRKLGKRDGIFMYLCMYLCICIGV